jgi:OOP family OmpA-OmpF porin
MKKLVIAAVVATSLLAGSAFAQVYVGAGAGAAKTDTNETSWKLYGGYQFNPMWGVELGYNDLGSYRGADIENVTVAATATLPLGQGWSLLGKLGAARNESNFANSSNHTDLLLGLGVGYALAKNVGVRLEYEDYGKLSDSNNGGDSKGRNLSVSVKYAF